jgi:hypothetical protein
VNSFSLPLVPLFELAFNIESPSYFIHDRPLLDLQVLFSSFAARLHQLRSLNFFALDENILSVFPYKIWRLANVRMGRH